MSEQTSHDTEPQPTTDSPLYQAVIDGHEYYVTASSLEDARLQAAYKHKDALPGPHIGISIEEYAEHAEVSDLSIQIKNQTHYDDGYGIANGDPFLAVLYRTEEDENTPSDRRIIPLGTGFESFNEIVITVAQIVHHPDHYHYEPVKFVPTHVEIYAIRGSASFEYESLA